MRWDATELTHSHTHRLTVSPYLTGTDRELHHIRITLWNINGFGDKLGDVDVQNFINSSGIVVLLETMKNDNFHVDYPGFCCWHFARGARHKNAKRSSGGFLVMIRENLSKSVQVSQNSDYAIWVTFKSGKSAPSFHAGFVYIPPMGSAHVTKYCPFETLQNEIIRKRASAEIIPAGDFNARTGEIDEAHPDNVMQNHPKLLELRMNDDKTINTYGKKLLQLLKNNDLLMLNSRTCFDTNTRNRQFTCHKYNGASVVDYVIAGPHIFNKILDFSVGNKVPDSDHCPLAYLVNYDTKSVHKYPRTRAETDNFSAYRWDRNAVGKYLAKLESNMVQHAYATFLCDIVDTNNIDINQVVQNFYHLIENVICDDFKKRSRTSKCTFPKTHGSTAIAKSSNLPFALLSGKIIHRRKPHLSESVIRALFNVKKGTTNRLWQMR